MTITVPLAARALQLGIALSMAYVAWLAWRGSRVLRGALDEARGRAGEPTGLADGLPSVSLIVPARNEEAVIGDTVRSLSKLRYHRAGAAAFEVLVVDDGSTDGTGAFARAAVPMNAPINVRRREPGKGPATKGAVLAFAMPFLSGSVIGVIDADTMVDPTLLERAMNAWRRDSNADALQVARVPRNASVSWLTRSQAEEQLMDLASQCGRWVTDGTAELRGNGMFVRREALDAAGGWSEVALTEDLELSTRLSACGRHVTLAPEAEVREEAVETIEALWRQRMRWAEGSLRRLLEHGPGLLIGSQPMTRKADFLAFTGEFVIPPVFVAAIAASLITIPLPRPVDWTVPLSLFVGYGLGVFILAIGGLWAAGERGLSLIGRATRGALFVSHWLIVVPVALVRIAFGPQATGLVQTRRSIRQEENLAD
ncbi:MAG: glycosyltransferase family 2 protein [Candidatus Limnocylindria bacterium]